MSARYQAYPEYKPSGVEWLGEIPTGWGRAPMNSDKRESPHRTKA